MASITKRAGKNGTSYKITVTHGRDAAGRQIRHFKTWKPGASMSARQADKEAQKVAYEFERDILHGFAADDRQTFAQYAEHFLSIREAQDRPQTIRRLKAAIKRINEHLGALKLNEIRPHHINAMYAAMSAPGMNRATVRALPLVDFKAYTAGEGVTAFSRRCGVAITVIQRLCTGRACAKSSAEKIMKATGDKALFEYLNDNASLNPNTIIGYHETVCAILGQAAREMILPYNPAERATPPKKKKSDAPKHMQPHELARFVEALESEPIRTRALFTLYAVTGCRRGEIIGLKWSKVDVINRTITVDTSLNYTPELGIFESKTKTGNVRKISLSGETIALLMAYRKWHEGERLKWGDQWQYTDYVFTNQTGGAIHANYINSLLIEVCDRHGLPRLHPHMFRHTAASIMIAAGVDVLSVAKTLGHADTSTTLDIYGHEIEEAKQHATDCLSEIVSKKGLTKPLKRGII